MPPTLPRRYRQSKTRRILRLFALVPKLIIFCFFYVYYSLGIIFFSAIVLAVNFILGDGKKEEK